MYILGAGLTGCIAALKYPDSLILEANFEPTRNHFALLRMRTDKIQNLTKIKFNKAAVSKYIFDGNDCTKNILPRHIIEYSKKTNGKAMERSISNLNDEVRYIPPPDFHNQLLDRISERVLYGRKVNSISKSDITTSSISATGYTKESKFQTKGKPIISTLPIAVNMDALGLDYNLRPTIEQGNTIYASQFTVPDYDLNMTIYFPNQDTNVYRASMVGSILIVETIESFPTEMDMEAIRFAFCINSSVELSTLHMASQPNGKIIPLEEKIRKEVLYNMTTEYNLYSLGHFACWRTILLDDIIQDIDKIDRMIKVSPYDRSL